MQKRLARLKTSAKSDLEELQAGEKQGSCMTLPLPADQTCTDKNYFSKGAQLSS
jgi:hypothetical protein